MRRFVSVGCLANLPLMGVVQCLLLVSFPKIVSLTIYVIKGFAHPTE